LVAEVMEAMPDGVVVTDQAGRIVRTSCFAREVTAGL
jgi:hypothetical protein